MEAKNNGGPAFPFSVHPEHGYGPAESVEAGMSLRDWFAGKALQGLCSNPGGPFQASSQCGWALTNCNESNVAATAYAMADAMLAERSKP